jgi:hypothetical protein
MSKAAVSDSANRLQSATTGGGGRGGLAGGQRGRAEGFTTITDLDKTLVVLESDG